MTQKSHKINPLIRGLIIAAIALAALAAAFGIFWAIRVNCFFEGWVLAGHGFWESGRSIEKVTAADLAVVDEVLGSNNISYKLNEDKDLVLVRNYNTEKAIELLQNCGYEFDGDIID